MSGSQKQTYLLCRSASIRSADGPTSWPRIPERNLWLRILLVFVLLDDCAGFVDFCRVNIGSKFAQHCLHKQSPLNLLYIPILIVGQSHQKNKTEHCSG